MLLLPTSARTPVAGGPPGGFVGEIVARVSVVAGAVRVGVIVPVVPVGVDPVGASVVEEEAGATVAVAVAVEPGVGPGIETVLVPLSNVNPGYVATTL